MATVSGPPVSLPDVRSVFGAPAGTPLHAFVRGGAYVPNSAANAGVPTAPPIALHQLAGATNYTPMTVTATGSSDSVPAGTVNASVGPASCSATGGNPSKSYTWTYVSGASFTISSPNSASTNFVQGGHPPAGTYTGMYKCSVNDGTATVVSNTVPVTVERT